MFVVAVIYWMQDYTDFKPHFLSTGMESLVSDFCSWSLLNSGRTFFQLNSAGFTRQILIFNGAGSFQILSLK